MSQDGTTVDSAKNTGNIARQTLTVPGTSFTQNYRYDALYRLTEAKETTGTNQNWIQNWSYDRYGNRLAFTKNIAGDTLAPNPSVDQNTNRFNSGQGFTYDKNGNIVQDVDSATSLYRSFVFNADNKQVAVNDANGNPIGQYFYDGEGKRVKKVTATETTVFVYSSGKLVAEYSTQLAPNPSINFTTTDHLGSPRIITDAIGQVKSRRDFLPFGEELNAGIGSRTGENGLKYAPASDPVRQKFTGYQKDSETSLDFAEARMYANELGRFTAVDPLLVSGKSPDPQTFNRYAYTSDNPISRVDRNGQNWYVAWEKVNGIWYTKPKWCEGLCSGHLWGSASGSFRDPSTGLNWNWSARSFVFQNPDNRTFTALDFFENRSISTFGSAEAAQAQIASWNRQAAVNFIAGALSGYSFAFEFSGAAEGRRAETSSQMFAMGQRAGTGATIATAITGVGIASAVIGKFGHLGLGILKGIRVAEGPLSAFEHAGVFGFDSYKNLRSALGTGSGLHVHHLIEKRFAGVVGQNSREMLSIVLTETEHAEFTRSWRELIPCGTQATKNEVENAARVVYKDHPDILNALGLN